MIEDVIRIFIPAITAFWVGILMTPLLTHYLHAWKVWKKKGGKKALDGSRAVEFDKLHESNETRTPRMGGIVVWGTVLITAGLFFVLGTFGASPLFESLDFTSRSQTWIPLMTLAIGALVGLVNDVLDVIETREAHGLPLSVRLAFVTLLSLFVGSWFYTKLGIDVVGIPFLPDLYLGIGVIPLFIVISLFLYASGVIDGIDGLSGGVFASIFSAYAFIAFSNGQYDLAAFCTTVVGGLLAFLWFNVPPARFWMTETGSMALTLTIATVAFLTDLKGEGNGVAALGIIAFVLVATVLSNVLQIFWKKVFKKKLFRIAPLHHHFEALGWPGHKVTMRYWILSIIFAITGVAFALLG